MSGAVFTLGNSVSGSLGLGDALSKFGRVAVTGLTIEQDPDTVNSYLTTRYAGLSAVTSGGVTTFLNPSLVVIPSAYNNGIVYSLHSRQVNTGDFTVTRNTEARRVNSAGQIASIGSGLPRLDYLTSGGTVGTPSLLVEPAGTNGILNSTDTATSWTLGSGLTSGAIDVIGVSGNNLTVAVSGSGIGSAAGRFVRFNNNVALASGSTYTVSFLMKKTGAHTIGGYQLTMSSGVVGSGFDVSGSFASGSNVDTAPTTNRIRRIERFGTDVFRCSETFTMTEAATGTHLAFGPVSAVSVSTNSAVGTTMGFAAPQLELGSVPTSFIPTTTGTGSRAADVISVSGAVSGSIGQTEGTIYAEVDFRNLGYNGCIITLQTDNWLTNSIQIQKSLGNQWRFTIRAANTVILNVDVGTITAGIYKIALGYNTATSGTVLAVNGSILSTQTASSIPACNSVVLGTRNETGTFTIHLNDRIRSAALYSTRLTNQQLQLLTTL